jgi:hypothetical protein
VLIRTVDDIGLNKLDPARFRVLIYHRRWEVRAVIYNAGDNPLLKPLRMLRKIPALERYFTNSIYAVIRKRSGVDPGKKLQRVSDRRRKELI